MTAGNVPCMHCEGYRCECVCETDCGSRPDFHNSYCPKAADYRDYLISTGLYPELS